MSGLVAAHLLHPEHDVTVFEAGAYAGGHTNTVTVDDAGPLGVDTGFIVFNDRNYPRFEALLAELGVAVAAVATCPSGSPTATSSTRARRRTGCTPSARTCSRRAFQRMVADVPRFQRAARELLGEPRGADAARVAGDARRSPTRSSSA